MEQFDQIYNENYRLIFNVVHKMVPNKDDASDLVQDVFINLYQKIENGTIIEYPRSWLYKVTVNKCIDFSKKRQKYERIETASQLKDENTSYEIDEKQIIIRVALSKLRSDERVLAILYSEGLSYREISEVTGIRFSSVGKTLSRTLTKLGNELKKFQHDLY